MTEENRLTGLFKPTKLKRLLFFLIADIFIISISFYFSFYLRFGFVFPEEWLKPFGFWIFGLIALKIFLLAIFGLYNINWRFVGLTEVVGLFKVGAASFMVLYPLNLIIRKYFSAYDLPRGIVVIDIVLSFFLFAFLRISKRMYILLSRRVPTGKRGMVIGADFTGERLIKELLFERDDHLYPVVVVDDDKLKIGTKIYGRPVLGGYNKIPRIVRNFSIDTALINLPRASHKQIGELFEIIQSAGITDIRVVPKVEEFDGDFYKLKEFKQLGIEDLLSREAVKVDFEEIKSYFADKTVLVTGSSGSIGSEIVRQLVRFEVKQLVAFEIDETEIFIQEKEISHLKGKHDMHFVMGDIRDADKLKQVFEQFNPDIVFHAAACKHVPLMEQFPEEAVKTNVLGTLNLVELARQNGCTKFINISTDKAVNPSSVMGGTKRLAEIICRSYSDKETQMISVRFGNVLGSRGSVVNLFLDQIKRGGPVEVTHPDMKRYFMSIQEAVLLVFQAAYMGQGKEVFVLDMGEPIKIIDLARKLILLNNLKPDDDIDIKVTGIRPGEKLFEELLTAEEGTDMTTHEKIFMAKNKDILEKEEINSMLQQLTAAIPEPRVIDDALKKWVPFYKDFC